MGRVDVVFDAVGGEVLDRSAAVLRPGGTLVTIAHPPTLRPEDGRAVYFIVEPNRDHLVQVVRICREGDWAPWWGPSVRSMRHRRRSGKRRGRPGRRSSTSPERPTAPATSDRSASSSGLTTLNRCTPYERSTQLAPSSRESGTNR
ncbi:zinc-binding dehydrogenase [Streptomyces chartreusis]